MVANLSFIFDFGKIVTKLGIADREPLGPAEVVNHKNKSRKI